MLIQNLMRSMSVFLSVSRVAAQENYAKSNENDQAACLTIQKTPVVFFYSPIVLLVIFFVLEIYSDLLNYS